MAWPNVRGRTKIRLGIAIGTITLATRKPRSAQDQSVIPSTKTKTLAAHPMPVGSKRRS